MEPEEVGYSGKTKTVQFCDYRSRYERQTLESRLMVTAMTSTRTLGSLDRSVSSITQHQMFRSAGPIQSEWCPVESNSIPATQRVLNPLVCRTNLHGNGIKKSHPVTVHAKYIMLKTTNTVWRLIRNSEHAIDRVAAWRKHLLHFCCNETKGDFFFFLLFTVCPKCNLKRLVASAAA